MWDKNTVTCVDCDIFPSHIPTEQKHHLCDSYLLLTLWHCAVYLVIILSWLTVIHSWLTDAHL